MAYNRLNFLTKVIDIQNITLEYQQRGVTKIWIYRNLIKEHYHISEATYRNYLCINAKREIKKLKGQ